MKYISGEKMKFCVYCGENIKDDSEEHIIQNALGGLITSTGICCSKCNQVLSSSIDKEFTSIFNPILGNFKNMVKTNNGNSKPSYTGVAIHKKTFKKYSVYLKQNKIVDCPELKKELKGDYRKDNLNDLLLLHSDFSLNNNAFKAGISKIAFNYAIYSGVNYDIVREFLVVEREDKIKISFDNPVIPFMPLNRFDEYWELERKFEPYHNLILFSQDNCLWCYVDLFNTFQCYVLLSSKWDRTLNKYNSYMQLLEKKNRETDSEIDDFIAHNLKDVMLLATQYDVPITCDTNKLKKDICNVIRKSSNKVNMQEYISNNFDLGYSEPLLHEGVAIDELRYGLESLRVYLDDDDRLKLTTYKQKTLKCGAMDNVLYSYPCELACVIKYRNEALIRYGHRKFLILCDWLKESNNKKYGCGY